MFAKTTKYLKDVTRNSKNVVRLAKSTLNAGKQASTLFRMCSTFSRSLIKNANKTPFIGMSAMFGASIGVAAALGAAYTTYAAAGEALANSYFAADADGKPTVIFVLGGPGAGKGTQCTNIVENFGFVHLSAGDLLREEMATPGSPYGQMIDEIIKNGQIVPSYVTVGLLRNAMDKNEKKKFLIDGFPRNFENNAAFERELGEKVDIPFILFFDVPEDIMEKRLLKRGQTSGRTDDNLESIKKRFRTFQEQSMPVIDYYAQKNKVVRVNGDRNPIDVFVDLRKVFEALDNNKSD